MESPLSPRQRFLLEQFALGECPPEQYPEAATLASTEAGRSELERLERSSGEILRILPPYELKRRMEAELRRQRAEPRADLSNPPGRFALKALLLPALALLLAVVIPGTGVRLPPPSIKTSIPSEPPPAHPIASSPQRTASAESRTNQPSPDIGLVPTTIPDDGFRRKGGGSPLHIVRSAPDGGTRTVANGDTLGPGEVLQIAAQLESPAYVAVLSIDGAGVITYHIPETPGAAPLLEPGTYPAPHAYELDDAPSFEQFLCVVSNTPFPTASAEELAKASAIRHLPTRSVYSLRIIKSHP